MKVLKPHQRELLVPFKPKNGSQIDLMFIMSIWGKSETQTAPQSTSDGKLPLNGVKKVIIFFKDSQRSCLASW